MFKKVITNIKIKTLAYILETGPIYIFCLMLLPYLGGLVFASEDKNLMRIVVLIELPLFLLILFMRFAIRKISRYLFNDIRLNDYLEFLNYLYRYSKGGKRRKLYSISYDIGRGQIAYLRGEFRKSDEILESISLTQFQGQVRKKLENQVRYYQLLNRIHRGQSVPENDFKKVNELEKKKLLAIYDIVNKKQNNFFALQKETNSLLELVEKRYYDALNNYHIGDFQTAKRNFEKIMDITEDIFYIREAKKHLEELQ